MSHEMVRRSRELRKRMTPAEKALWVYLRAKRFSQFKFYNQRPIGRFIADFYCARARLIIEVDGGIHEQQRERDQARDAWFQSRDILTLRITNEEVLLHRERTLRSIADLVLARTSPGSFLATLS